MHIRVTREELKEAGIANLWGGFCCKERVVDDRESGVKSVSKMGELKACTYADGSIPSGGGKTENLREANMLT